MKNKRTKKEEFLAMLRNKAKQYRGKIGIEAAMELASGLREDSIPDDVAEAAQIVINIAFQETRWPPGFWN